MDRRKFLKKIILRVLYFSVGIILSYPILRFIGYRKKIRRFVVVDPQNISSGVIFQKGVYLIKGDKGFFALSSSCPHLGCKINYRDDSGYFKCPCHGSMFDKNGKWLSGPAKKDMVHLPYKILKSGKIKVTVVQEGPV